MSHQKVTEEIIRVRYGETDQMGHAYYGNYLLWLEQSRGAWCRDRGFTYKSLEEKGFKLPVVEVWLKYKGEIKYDDLITIRVWLDEVKRASMKFKYEVIGKDDSVLTEAYSWHVLVGESMRATSIKGEIEELLYRDPEEFEQIID